MRRLVPTFDRWHRKSSQANVRKTCDDLRSRLIRALNFTSSRSITICGLLLQHCYDKEKEALLAALRNNDARFAGERQRQAELARLRRDERKARQEEKFDTAALVLGLAQAQKANLEEM